MIFSLILSLLGVCMGRMLLWTCEMLWIVVWVWKCGCCRENNSRICCSRPSETDSPRRDLQKPARVILELSLRRRALVLSEALSRSGERRLPKWGCVGALVCCYSLIPGEEPHFWAMGDLARARMARLSECAKNLPRPLSRSRLSESL